MAKVSSQTLEGEAVLLPSSTWSLWTAASESRSPGVPLVSVCSLLFFSRLLALLSQSACVLEMGGRTGQSLQRVQVLKMLSGSLW